MKNSKGISLLEIIICIVIVSILLSLILGIKSSKVPKNTPKETSKQMNNKSFDEKEDKPIQIGKSLTVNSIIISINNTECNYILDSEFSESFIEITDTCDKYKIGDKITFTKE